MNRKCVIITGGAGFIGCNFVRLALKEGFRVVVIDKLTYSGSMRNIDEIQGRDDFDFVKADICDRRNLVEVFNRYKPAYVVNFAAESHVDRSIQSVEPFLKSNVQGTLSLLEASLAYLTTLGQEANRQFRYLQVSTDEVYGSLAFDDPSFVETSQIAPNNPYSASKAAGDNFVRAFGVTHHLPTLITRCSNNYGPFQYPEKLIPTIIQRALAGESIPIYGDGSNRRDWLHVQDHCDAILAILHRGQPGEVYNIGGGHELSNLELASMICSEMDLICPSGKPYAELIEYVADRKGHDFRYSINYRKLRENLDWQPVREFKTELGNVVRWYVDNQNWLEAIKVDDVP